MNFWNENKEVNFVVEIKIWMKMKKEEEKNP
jgi:hypothetical protein